MLALIILVSLVGILIAFGLDDRAGDGTGRKRSVAQTIALGVAIVVAAAGLLVVGAGIFFAMAMSSYGSNK